MLNTIVFLLAVVAIAPGVSIVAGLLLMIVDLNQYDLSDCLIGFIEPITTKHVFYGAVLLVAQNSSG